jgi:hypothetical protein
VIAGQNAIEDFTSSRHSQTAAVDYIVVTHCRSAKVPPPDATEQQLSFRYLNHVPLTLTTLFVFGAELVISDVPTNSESSHHSADRRCTACHLLISGTDTLCEHHR